MISQVENKEMVADAYNAGINFYITKPINKIEVSSVISNVIRNYRLKKSIRQIKNTLRNIDYEVEQISNPTHPLVRQKTMEVLADIGVIGEAGVDDLCAIINFLYQNNKTKYSMVSLRELYYKVLLDKNINKEITEGDLKALEQRIRRLVKNAMDNLASLGLEDFNDYRFENYSGKFFDYREVRKRMTEFKQNKNKSNVRINIKKFIFSLLFEVRRR